MHDCGCPFAIYSVAARARWRCATTMAIPKSATIAANAIQPIGEPREESCTIGGAAATRRTPLPEVGPARALVSPSGAAVAVVVAPRAGDVVVAPGTVVDAVEVVDRLMVVVDASGVICACTFGGVATRGLVTGGRVTGGAATVVVVAGGKMRSSATYAGVSPVPQRQPSMSPSCTVVAPAPTRELVKVRVPAGARA